MNAMISNPRKTALPRVVAMLALLAAAQLPAAPALSLPDCLRADRVERWHVEGERALLVRSAGRHFRVELRHECADLGRGGFLTLGGAQATRDFVCGNVGEYVKSRYGDCAIGVVTPLTRKEFLRQVKRLR